MANALVIGMGGVGSVIGQKLHSYACFERIVLADVDTTHAQRLDAHTPNSRFEVAQLNATDTNGLAEFLRDRKIAVVCNACTWQANHSVLTACAEAGAHYLDMAADIFSPRGVQKKSCLLYTSPSPRDS